MNQEVIKLNAAIKSAAVAAGLTYVDEYNSLGKHELCSSKPWVYAASLPITKSFHPTEEGQKAIGVVLRRVLTS